MWLHTIKKEEEMTKLKVGLALLVVLTAFALTALPASAQETATVVIGNATLAPLTNATIPIWITIAAENVSSAQIRLLYDPQVIQVIAVGGSDFDIFWVNINNSVGMVKMLGYQWINGSLRPPVKFAEVTIRAIGKPGDYSPLNLGIVEIVGKNKEGVFMSHGSRYNYHLFGNGIVTIIAGVPIYNIPGMIALVGLLALIPVVTLRKRR
jgi:hypothetical protein